MSMKRSIDFFVSVIALFFLWPVFLLFSIWIKMDSPGPVFFKQKRVGIHKSHFEILKFRTMRTDTPKDMPTHLLKDPEQFITRSGRFLRKTSLDELPQLLNIVKGDMSIVGPRPALWNQFDLLEERDKYGANDVVPGLTGWAQIHGRDTISIQEKAKLDGYYVEHQSLWLDIKCIFLTILSVWKREGIQEGGTGVNEKQDRLLKEPLVSVIVATYRRDKELKRALASLANQEYTNFEVLLVDDNAQEEWNQKVEHLVEKWRAKTNIPLIYIQNQENRGSAASRNLGIERSNGEYVTFLDDDDKYEKEKIRHQVNHMLQKKSDYSITDLALYKENGNLEEVRTRYYLNGEKLENSSRLLALHLMHHMTGTDTLMFKKMYLKQIGGFPPIDMGDEFYLMKEAITSGGSFSYLPLCDVKAMVHTKTEGLSSKESKINGEHVLYEYKKQFFDLLKKKEIQQIRMRHHLVLAYAYLRNREYSSFVIEGCKSVCFAPIACLRLVCKRKG